MSGKASFPRSYRIECFSLVGYGNGDGDGAMEGNAGAAHGEAAPNDATSR